MGGVRGKGVEVRSYLKVVCLHKFLDILSVCPKIVGLDVQRAIERCDHPYSTVCRSLSMMDSILGCIFGHIFGIQPITAPSRVRPSVRIFVSGR